MSLLNFQSLFEKSNLSKTLLKNYENIKELDFNFQSI
jgi:hypothetical protein